PQAQPLPPVDLPTRGRPITHSVSTRPRSGLIAFPVEKYPMKSAASYVVGASLLAALAVSPRASSGASKGDAMVTAASGLGANAPILGRRCFPEDNPWNRDVSHDPVDPNSSRIVNSIGSGNSVHPDFGDYFGKPYVVVPGDQRKVRVTFGYESQS